MATEKRKITKTVDPKNPRPGTKPRLPEFFTRKLQDRSKYLPSGERNPDYKG